MNNILFRFFKNFDFVLLGSVLLLLVLGLSVLFSATEEYTIDSIVAQQGINIIIGIIILFVISKTDYRLFKSYTGVLYIGVILMLFAVKVFGLSVKGAERWIDLGFFQLQPSTLAQLLMVIILAKYFSENYEEMHGLKAVLKSGVYVAIPTLLIAWQPDFGSAILVVFVWAVMLLASNAKRLYIALFGAIGLTSLPLVWVLLADYQKERVFSFLNPTADPMGSGWNVNQAIIAIGSGQMWGRGLGHGTQSQLNYIPEKHTDFIYAMLAEEMGFMGVTLLLGLLFIVMYRGIRISILARDFFGTYIAIGVIAMLFVHIFINIGMNMGIMPVTGIPLPFISYGGTAIIVNLAAIGLLQSVFGGYKKIDF